MLPSYKRLKQRRILMKGFVDAQVDQCSSICMFCGTVLNKKSNPLHERSPGTVYRGSTNYFCK